MYDPSCPLENASKLTTLEVAKKMTFSILINFRFVSSKKFFFWFEYEVKRPKYILDKKKI
jgi:hypothetical protein